MCDFIYVYFSHPANFVVIKSITIATDTRLQKKQVRVNYVCIINTRVDIFLFFLPRLYVFFIFIHFLFFVYTTKKRMIFFYFILQKTPDAMFYSIHQTSIFHYMSVMFYDICHVL